MKTTNNSKGLKYALIFLLVLNISTLATIGFHMWETAKGVQQTELIHSPSDKNFSGKYFKERLQLSDQQMELFREVNVKFRQQARKLNDQLVQCRIAMMDEMQQQTIDTLKLMELSTKIGDLHKELKVYTFQFYIDIKKICSLEQQNLLNQVFSEFFINDTPMINQSNGSNKNRFQNGKRNNN